MDEKQLYKLSQLVVSLKTKVKCPICLDHIKKTVELACTHRFCSKCILELKAQSAACPLCKQSLGKRSPIYKDLYADELSIFINRTCQIIKEKYAYEVDELCSKGKNLKEIIKTAPKDAPTAVASTSKISPPCDVETHNEFDKLITIPRKCYSNKRKQSSKVKVLDFDNDDSKTKIISWLNANQEKLDALTQSPQFFCNDESEFDMPSVSQAVSGLRSGLKYKKNDRIRSQSFTVNDDHLPEPLVKRYHSLTENINDYDDDYNIEEVHSETLVKQVERRVLQDMLEDECLANLDNLAQINVKKSPPKNKKTPKKRKFESADHNISASDASSGWDRIKKVKKSLKKASKEPEQLKINLQDTSPGSKKSPKEKGKKVKIKGRNGNTCSEGIILNKSSKEVRRTKRNSSTSACKEETNNENVGRNPKNCPTSNKDSTSVKAKDALNLSFVEKFFKKHLEKVTIEPDKSKTGVEKKIPTKNAEMENGNAANINIDNHKNLEEDIFNQPTQISPASAEKQNNIFSNVSCVPEDINEVDNIVVRLSDNLSKCILTASNLQQDNMGQQLVECFSKLLTYVDKIIDVRSKKVSTEMQTLHVAKESKSVQVSVDTVAVRTQTIKLPLKVDKSVQIAQKLCNVDVQTDRPFYVEQGVQTTQNLTRNSGKVEKYGKGASQSLDCSFTCDNLCEDVGPTGSRTRTNKKSSQSSSKHSGKEKQIYSSKTSQNSKSSKELRISVDESKENKSSKASNITSPDSVLVCSLVQSNKSGKNISKKLFEETQNRKFKRIRKPASDSDSDGDKNPSKRKFIRDDLTVEFIDTEKAEKSMTGEQKDNSTPESEKMDYDKYLLEVLTRYDTSPPKKKDATAVPKKVSNTSTNETAKASVSKLQNSSKFIRNSQCTGSLEASQRSKDTFSGDHLFTAHVALEANLDKFDQEILEYERSTKNFNTELDLVENTPVTSPKPKITRLSNKKKSSIAEPLQILSKGSAGSSNIPNKGEIPMETNPIANSILDKDPSTLDRNVTRVPSFTEKCTDDVDNILEDLRNDNDFFKTNLEIDENDELNPGQSTNVDNLNMADQEMGKTVNVTQENIDKVLVSMNDFGMDEDGIEEELQKISFTAAQKETNKENKVNIIQNVKIRSQDKLINEDQFDDIIESSDEEIVETTPQKRKNTSSNKSILENLQDLEEPFEDHGLDVCLPPPPGFGDEMGTSPLIDDPRESQTNQKENGPPRVNKSSVTPDRLSDFILTPAEKTAHSQSEESQQSISFKPSFVTPGRPAQGKSEGLRISQIMVEPSESTFSPVAKSSVKLTQPKYTPLICTPRPPKKSSLMTSTPNQKSILGYMTVPSQESPAIISQKSKPCIMWSRILNKDLNIFTQLECKKLLTTSKTFNPQVTHLVVLVDEKGQIVSHTAKILQAIAAGIWVVRYEWAQDCLQMNKIVPEEPYEALDTTGEPGPKNSRLSKGAKKLFSNFKFYCAPPLKTVPKHDVESILQLSGAEIAKDLCEFLENDGKVHIILTESSVTEETVQFEAWLEIYKAVTVDVEWLTSCIGKYKLVSFRPFLISGEEPAICDLGYPLTLVESVPFTLTEAM